MTGAQDQQFLNRNASVMGRNSLTRTTRNRRNPRKTCKTGLLRFGFAFFALTSWLPERAEGLAQRIASIHNGGVTLNLNPNFESQNPKPESKV
jgi:hypothetical protein